MVLVRQLIILFFKFDKIWYNYLMLLNRIYLLYKFDDKCLFSYHYYLMVTRKYILTQYHSF